MKKLHIDTLKIDQSFIRDCTDKSNAAIIQGIITISKKWDLKPLQKVWKLTNSTIS